MIPLSEPSPVGADRPWTLRSRRARRVATLGLYRLCLRVMPAGITGASTPVRQDTRAGGTTTHNTR